VSLAQASVRRPVLTAMATLMVLVLGMVALTRLKIDLLPSIELPTLTIRTQYEGADPVVMERLVTQIVEEIVATVPGVEEVTSSLLPQVCHLQDKCQSDQSVKFQYGTTFVVPYKS